MGTHLAFNVLLQLAQQQGILEEQEKAMKIISEVVVEEKDLATETEAPSSMMD